MKLKNLIWRFMFVSVFLISAQYIFAQTENTEEDPFAALHVTFPGEVIRMTEPNNIWEPEAQLVKTETHRYPFNYSEAPRSMTYSIYSDGTQKCQLENGDFVYFKADSVMNEYTGEKEPNLNYRLPDNPNAYTVWPGVYFPQKRGILARRRYKTIEWVYYRMNDNEPVKVKRVSNHYILTKDLTNSIGVGGFLSGNELVDGSFNGTTLKTKHDGRTYNFDPELSAFVNEDSPFCFASSSELKWDATSSDLQLFPNRQLVTFRDKKTILAVAPSDSIMNLEDKSTYAIAHYANGDYVKYSLMKGKEWQPFEASLKRGDGKIGRYIKNKGGRLMDAIEFTTGPCKGFFMVNHLGNILTESPINWHGDVYDAGFNYITHINEEGLTTEQRAEGKAKIEARIYQSYCQKYGKQYVDALKEHKILPGMPEALVKDVLHYRSLSKSAIGERCAVFLSSPYFSTIENKFTDQEPTSLTIITSEYFVTFANGKVASVTFIK